MRIVAKQTDRLLGQRPPQSVLGALFPSLEAQLLAAKPLSSELPAQLISGLEGRDQRAGEGRQGSGNGIATYGRDG